MQLGLRLNALFITKVKVTTSFNPKHCVMCLCDRALIPFPVASLDDKGLCLHGSSELAFIAKILWGRAY